MTMSNEPLNVRGEPLRLDPIGTDLTDAIALMADGNPGAIGVMVSMAKVGAATGLFVLDALGIYGAEIWTLYADEHGKDLLATMYDMADRIGKHMENGYMPVTDNDNSTGN